MKRCADGTIGKIRVSNMVQPARRKTGKMAGKRTTRRGAAEPASKHNVAGKLASMIEQPFVPALELGEGAERIPGVQLLVGEAHVEWSDGRGACARP